MSEPDIEALRQSVVRSGATAVLVNDSDWNAIIAALEDRERLRTEIAGLKDALAAALEDRERLRAAARDIMRRRFVRSFEADAAWSALRAALEGRDG